MYNSTNLMTYVFPLQTRVIKPGSDLVQPQVPRTTPCPVSLGDHYLKFCLLILFSIPCQPAAPELGCWLLLKINPSQSVILTWGNFLIFCSPNLYPFLHTVCPWCKDHTVRIKGATHTCHIPPFSPPLHPPPHSL